MGVLSVIIGLDTGLPGMNSADKSTFLNILRHCDDNTGETVINGKKRMNIIGHHAYPSAERLSVRSKKHKSNISRSYSNLQKEGWIKHTANKANNVKEYAANFSLLIRISDANATEDAECFQEKYGNDYKNSDDYKNWLRFFETFCKYIEGDFQRTPITQADINFQRIIIDNWRELLESGEEAIRDYAVSYRDKKLSVLLRATPTITMIRKHTAKTTTVNFHQ